MENCAPAKNKSHHSRGCAMWAASADLRGEGNQRPHSGDGDLESVICTQQKGAASCCEIHQWNSFSKIRVNP